jgi:hypothetical protein
VRLVYSLGSSSGRQAGGTAVPSVRRDRGRSCGVVAVGKHVSRHDKGSQVGMTIIFHVQEESCQARKGIRIGKICSRHFYT